MTTLVARIKILPADVAVNLDSLLSKVKNNIPSGMSLKSSWCGAHSLRVECSNCRFHT